jgi:proline-specific peptidase
MSFVDGQVDERRVSVPGGTVWTGTYGHGSGPALLCLHGGPGMPSYYLEDLTALAETRMVVLYDQLGCGRSARPHDADLWTVDRAVAEVEAVRSALGLSQVHLLGHSWGGFLAVAYAREHPEHLVSLVLSSPLIAVGDWMDDAAALVETLSVHARDAIRRHEAAGTYDHPDYAAATEEFYRRYFCRLEPWPASLQRTFAEMGEGQYRTLWGPSEFTQTGRLRGEDLTPALDRLAPSLWICGSDDEARPSTVRRYAKRAAGQLAVIDGGSHCVHMEERARYLGTVGEFLARWDS